MKKIVFILFSVLLSSSFFAQTFTVGEQVMAFEDDDMLWYKATILESGTSECKIHWEGFAAEHDQMMSNDNIWKEGMEFLVSDKLQGLETDGKWYNAKVLKRDLASKKYFIHWGGFDEKYDRWISYDSLRLPTKANYIAEGNFNTSKTSSSSSAYGSTRISIVYLENKTGQTIKYSYSGDGSSGGGTIYNGQKDNIKNAPIGADLKVNGNKYITIQKSHDGQTIIINHL